MTTKICYICDEEYPANTDFFYPVSGKVDGLANDCISCRKEKSKHYHRRGRKSNKHELNFIEECGKHGIPALHASLIKNISHVDVLVWGCIRVEVKYPRIQGGQYVYAFTVKQSEERLPCDLIVLVFPDGDNYQYHFFSPLHPVFFHKNQKRKQGVAYIPDATQRRGTNGVTLTPEIMAEHHDNWHMIETMRLDKMQQLKAEYRRTLPATEPTESAAA